MNLDREIAEKVFGWETDANPSDPSDAAYKVVGITGEPIWITLPKFSTNIQHAMEVEAEMAKKGFFVEMGRRRGHDKPSVMHWVKIYRISLTAWGNPVHFKSFYEESGSLPTAICRAALAALEEE